MKLIERTYNAGPYSDPKIAFIYCVDCDEMIAEGRVAAHKRDGHRIETTLKAKNRSALAVKNAGPCAVCDHGADKHADYGDRCAACGCRGFVAIINSGDDDDPAFREAMKRVMSQPAKPKASNSDPAHPSGEDDDEEGKIALETATTGLPKMIGTPIDKVLENAVQQGLLSNMAAQKLATRDGFPKPVTIKYIMPGLVEYEYMNNGQGARVLVTKNALDKMLADPEKTIVGKPVINEAHRDVSPDDYKNGTADGIVTRAWYEPSDGWYYCEALVWDDETRKNIQNGYSVSCEYTALPPWGPAGTLNQVTYDKEVTDGRYKHLAVVSGPRYEGARIMNSQGGNTMMKLFQWIKGKDQAEVKNSVDIDPDKTAVEIEGKEVPLANAIAAFREQEAAKVKAAADAAAAEALKNAKKLTDEDVVNIDGKDVKVSDLKNAMAAKAKNDADEKDEKDEKDHKDGEHENKKAANCKMCNGDMVKGDCPKCDGTGQLKGEDCGKCGGTGIYYTAKNAAEEEKEKKDAEAKNAVLMNSQHRLGQHSSTPNEKCAICDGIQAERLTNAAKTREGKLPTPVVPSIDDGLKRGRQLMGKTRAQQEAEMAAK